MATQGGAENPIVIADRYQAVESVLREVPFEFDFFQAVRLLERMGPSLHTGGGVVGRFEQPGREAVRFSAHASFPFPASQIQRIDFQIGRAHV